MNYFIKLSLLIFFFLLFLVNKSYSSHYMGGEITWECIPAGQPDAGKFIFTLRVYRECGGLSFGTYQTLYSTSTAGNIPMNLVSGWPKDISPNCNISGFSGTGISEITCSGAEITGADNTGAVSEYLYISAPVMINGVPPAGGWTFYWGTCCRNPSTNVNGLPGWKLRAKMYAFNNQNTYPCFDNSPVFAETAKSVLPIGYPTEYSNYAFDKDLDKLTFEWGVPLEFIGVPVVYNSGYSYDNPLPDTYANINNVAAVLDSATGLVSFTSYTTGAFVTSVKVSSYKSGQLVAEIWRDIQVVLLNSGTNTPPTVSITAGTVFQDTVIVGDTVSFLINGSDLGFLPNGLSQTIELEAYGEQFGSYIPASGANVATFSQTSGCAQPPCASLTPAPNVIAPLTSTLGIQSSFYWETSLNHLFYSGTTGYLPYTYNFIFGFKDDYCPAPALKTTIVSITIMPKEILSVPQIQSAVKNQVSEVVLKWNPIIDDVDTLFQAYYIYKSISSDSNFYLIDSITNQNIGTYAYNYNLDPPMYFRLGLKQKVAPITFSNTVSNMVLSSNEIDNCVNKLQWNSFDEGDASEYYKIYKKSPSNTWVFIDSTFNNNYMDTTLLDLTYYKVKSNIHQLYDSMGNMSITASETGIINSFSTMNIGSDTSIYENDSYYIITDFGFDTYEWQNGFTLNYYFVNGYNLGVGTYDIWLKANTIYGCEKIDSLVIEVQETISIDDSENEEYLKIFPNPTDGKFNLEIITSTAQNAMLEIVSISGESIYSSNVDLSIKKNLIKIDISKFAKGVYYIRLKGETMDIVKPITVQ